MVTPEQWSEIRDVALCSTFAAVSGALSYLVKVREGQMFKWGEFFLHFAVSALAGIVAYHVLHYLNVPVDLAGALCGIAGWSGTRLMRVLEIIMLMRVSGGKDDVIEKADQKESEK